MPLTLSPTAYAGTAAAGFVVKAMLENEPVAGGHLYVQDGIKHSYTIPRLTIEDLIQDPTETPSDGATAVVDGTTLTPQDYLIYLEFSPRLFEHHWFAEGMPAALLDARLPATVESALVQEVLRQHASYLGKAVFQGDTAGVAPYDKFDGLIAKAAAASDTITVTGQGAITASNIVEVLESCYAAIPDALRPDPNFKLFVSHTTADLYRQAQQAQATKGVDFTAGAVMRYAGKQLVALSGMPDDTVFGAKATADASSNLWLGINSRADENYVRVMPLANNSDRWFLKMLMKADVQIAFPEETLLYQA